MSLNFSSLQLLYQGAVTSEAGTHDELLRRNGDYSSFMRLQALEKTTK
jgi:ABC-type multidrug transport system fused ATPase/permease subunit